jgi:RNA polymerase sigma-70 factor, ECF subfamily
MPMTLFPLVSEELIDSAAGCSRSGQSTGWPIFGGSQKYNNHADDRELARRISDGDMAAFEMLYSAYHARVYKVCYRLLRKQQEAEDLTHDIFIHLFSKISSYRGDAALSTWLHKLTVNKVLMHFRKSSVRREMTTETGEMTRYPAVATRNPGQESRLALEAALTAMPVGYRTVLVLHDVEGYEHAEISRMTGISIGTSKSQLHKARRKMIALMKDGPNGRTR